MFKFSTWDSLSLSLCIICGLWCVVKQLFNALIRVADFLSIIHFAHAYFEKWSTIVNKYLYGLVHNTLANCTKSIWHLSKGLELRMWWTISLFLSFPELTCYIWHLNQKFLTSLWMLSHLYPSARIWSWVAWILRWLPVFTCHS